VSFPSPCRKRLFVSEVSVPPLLYACHDSRVAALAHYDLGFHTKMTIGSSRGLRAYPGYDCFCPYDGQLEACGKVTYWAPENDVVMLEHRKDPYCCDEKCKCNNPHFRWPTYKLDDRIKYMAITMEIWNAGTGHIALDVPHLEVLFVLVDQKPRTAFLDGYPTTEHNTFEAKERASCRVVEVQMEQAIKAGDTVFRLVRGIREIRLVKVFLVESEGELVDEVAKLRNESIRR